MDETIIVHGMPDETELAALIVVLKVLTQRAAIQRVLTAGATSRNEGARPSVPPWTHGGFPAGPAGLAR
jgi:hypothetical protein